MIGRAAVKYAALILCAFALSGCTRFEHPLVGDKGAQFDTRILGRWVFDNEEGRFEIEVLAQGDGALVHPLAVAPRDGSGPVEVADMHLVTTRVGQLDFGSALPIASPAEGWSIFRYKVDGDRLTLVFGDDDFWRAAIEDQRIAGALQKGRYTTTALVSASSDELRRFLDGYAPVGFPDDPEPEFVFERAR